MMPLDPLTIAFAVVAVIVIWKLYSILGSNTGFRRDEPPRRQGGPARRSDPGAPWPQPTAAAAPAPRKLLRLPRTAAPNPEPAPVAAADPKRWDGFVEEGSSATTGLEAIAAADRTFSAAPFIDGAKTAYEAVITAFASGERKMLQTLLARDVFDGFAAAIAARDKRGETLTVTFVSVDEPKIVSAALQGKTARVAVRFISRQISATRTADGTVVDGSPDQIADVNDIWTFARTVGARDPNWKLVATEAGH